MSFIANRFSAYSEYISGLTKLQVLQVAALCCPLLPLGKYNSLSRSERRATVIFARVLHKLQLFFFLRLTCHQEKYPLFNAKVRFRNKKTLKRKCSVLFPPCDKLTVDTQRAMFFLCLRSSYIDNIDNKDPIQN